MSSHLHQICSKEVLFRTTLQQDELPQFYQSLTLQPCADKKNLVRQLLEAKQASGKTYTEIAKEVGLTNLYTAQLFQNQVCFPPSSLLYIAGAS